MKIEELWKKAIRGEKGFFYDLFRLSLHLLSLFYLPLFHIFRWTQSLRQVKLPCPVISIGNLTLGGTGKTSLEKVMGIAGIGCPEGFRKTLEGLGGEVYFKAFPDHYDFKRKDIISLLREAKSKGLSAIVMTEKDGIKIRELMGRELTKEIPFFVLRVELVISQDELFWRKINAILEE